MSQAKKEVVSEGKGVTPQEDVGSDSSSELLAKMVAVIEEKFLGFGKRLDSISECLEQKLRALTTGNYSGKTKNQAEVQVFSVVRRLKGFGSPSHLAKKYRENKQTL